MQTLPAERAAFLARVRAFIPQAEAMGVPGAVLVAQAVLESGWGRSGLARLGGAWFGIKADARWMRAVYSGTTREWVPERGLVVVPGVHRVYASRTEALAAGCASGSLFRAYGNVVHNVRDYLRFFHANPRYHSALQRYGRGRDARRFAADLATAGYATAPDYGRRLLRLMERVVPDLLQAGQPGLWLAGRPVPAEALLIRGQRMYVRIHTLARLLGWRITYDHARKAVHVSRMEEEGRR